MAPTKNSLLALLVEPAVFFVSVSVLSELGNVYHVPPVIWPAASIAIFVKTFVEPPEAVPEELTVKSVPLAGA